MSDVNLHISMTNLTRLDAHQNDLHKNPIVHQEQNAQMAEDEAVQRMNMPVEPNEVEEKRIDPEDKRHSSKEQGKKRNRQQKEAQQRPPSDLTGGEHFIDVQA